MTGIVVADAGPLIALAKTERLHLLQKLYSLVLIPPTVFDELEIDSKRPGAVQLNAAWKAGWLEVKQLSSDSRYYINDLLLIVDVGEAEAILLAEQVKCRFLLIDEIRGRILAKRREIPIAGVGGVLIAAKKKGLIKQVKPLINELTQAGYRMSKELIDEITRLANELSNAK